MIGVLPTFGSPLADPVLLGRVSAFPFLAGLRPSLYSTGTVNDVDVVFTDNTTNDSSTTKHGFLKKLDNDATHFMDGQGNWSQVAYSGLSGTPSTFTPAAHHTNHEPGGSDAVNWGAGWDVYIVKSADQSVTNSNTLTDDSELQFSVTAGDIWWIEYYILYEGTSTAADFKMDFAVAAGSFTGFIHHIFWSNLGGSIQVNTAIQQTALAAWSNAAQCDTNPADTTRVSYGEAMEVFTNTTTFKIRFAQNTQTAAHSAKIKAKSVLRARKISP